MAVPSNTRNSGALLDEAAIALKDDCLGFTLARDFDPRKLGLLYYVMASSQSLGDALKRVARYSQITNEALVIRYREGNGPITRPLGRAGLALLVELGCAPRSRRRRPRPRAANCNGSDPFD